MKGDAFDDLKRLNAECITVVNGLLKIAKVAMPGTFFETDSRVLRAKKLLRKLKEQTP